MKVSITYTVYTEDHLYIEWFSTSYIEQVAKSLKYKLLKRTVGQHIDASRKHYHIVQHIAQVLSFQSLYT